MDGWMIVKENEKGKTFTLFELIRIDSVREGFIYYPSTDGVRKSRKRGHRERERERERESETRKQLAECIDLKLLSNGRMFVVDPTRLNLFDINPPTFISF
jgi:hypothetical protein